MKKTIFTFYIALLVSHCIVITVQAAPEVQVNGLYGGRAIMTIDGATHMFSPGQSRSGVKLIEANDERAIVEIKGVRKTLGLDKSIAKEYSKPEPSLRNGAKSHIIAANLLHETDNIATFEVDYFYDGRKGEHVTLSAKTLFKSEVTDYWNHSFTKLKKGRNKTTITLSTNDKAPKTYFSDAVRFDLHWAGEKESGVAGSKVIEYIKEWKQ